MNTKRTIRSYFHFALFVCINVVIYSALHSSAFSLYAADSYAGQVTTTKKTELKAEPDVDSKTLKKIKAGKKFEVVGEETGKNGEVWLQVKFGKKIAFIDEDSVEKDKVDGDSTAEAGAGTTTMGTNIDSGADVVNASEANNMNGEAKGAIGEEQASAELSQANLVKIKGTNINVREEAATTSKVISKVTEGDLVEVLVENIKGGGYTWSKIQLSDGKVGFIVSKYLDK